MQAGVAFEEVVSAGLKRLAQTFDVEYFGEAGAQLRPCRQRRQILFGELRFGLYPRARRRRIEIFKTAVGVRYRRAVIIIDGGTPWRGRIPQRCVRGGNRGAENDGESGDKRDVTLRHADPYVGVRRF